MYRLNSAKHLISGGAAYRHNATHSYCRRVVSPQAEDDFVYVGKGYKICCKDEIISNSRNTKWSGFQQKIKKRTYKRKVLPPALLSRSVVKLTCESAADGGVCDVYVVGTDHECEKTWRETQRVIKFLKPQVVFLELCSNRVYVLTQQNDKVPSIGEMLDMWRKKKEDPLLILLKWFLAKMMSHGEIWTGVEFRVAYQEAMQYGGKVILGDRPIEITMRRIMANMSAWRSLFHPHNVTIPEDLLKTANDEMDRINLRQQELTRKFPTYWVPLVHERDRYMAAKILKVAREHNSVVAVVGKAHLAGIQNNWKQPVDIKQLLDTRTHTLTMGKMLSSFGAMIFFLSLSDSQRKRIENFLSNIL